MWVSVQRHWLSYLHVSGCCAAPDIARIWLPELVLGMGGVRFCETLFPPDCGPAEF